MHYRNKNKLFSLFLLAENHTSLRVGFYFSLAKEKSLKSKTLGVPESKVTKTMVAESIVTKTMVPNSFQKKLWCRILSKTMVPNSFPKQWFRILFPKKLWFRILSYVNKVVTEILYQKRICVFTKDFNQSFRIQTLIQLFSVFVTISKTS